MNLLGAVSYDPSTVGGVSKATSSLLAMTALDTSNLRVAVTIPAHGKIFWRIMGCLTGATTVPSILVGLMNGATVVGRATPQIFTGTQNAATQNATFVAEGYSSGLTPGAMNLDAAYAVQVIVASTNIKYGGANTNAGANAWGAFTMEVWDPQPLPVAIAPGAANGLQICGNNAATVYATLTSTGAFSVNGANAVSQTGDAYARLGAPAGASVSADVAAIQAKTTNLPASPASTTNITAGTITTVTTVTNQLTAAQVATGVWQDATAGDFTAANSIGKSVMNGVALGTGLTVARCTLADTLTTYTGNTVQTGDSFARLGAPAGASHSADVAAVKVDTAAVKLKTDNLPASPASTTNITAGTITTTTNVTNAVTVGTNNDKTGYALSSAGVQAVWDALTSALTTVGSIGKRIVDYLTGDSYTRIGAAGAGLTALGDTRIANLDAAVSTRLASASYTAPPSAASNATAVRTELTTELGRIDAAVSTRSTLAAGEAMTLTTGERTAIANEVEAQIIDDTDSEKVLTAITDKIASVNPSLGALTLAAIASAVRDQAVAGASANSIGAALAALAARLPGSGTIAIATDIPATDITAIKGKTDNLPAAPASTGDVTTVGTAVAAVQATAVAVQVQTDQITFTDGNVNANAKALGDRLMTWNELTQKWGPA